MFQVKKAGVTAKIPPHVYFFVSAIFHYLGPAFAVLLFSNVSVLGVAWFRIASAAVVFAAWRRPWRFFVGISWAQRRVLLALGIVLALMNACFYLAISRIPLGTVGAIEFLGPITLAALGARTPRNIGALLLAVGGVLAPHGCTLWWAATWLCVRFCQLCLLYALCDTRSSHRRGWRCYRY